MAIMDAKLELCDAEALTTTSTVSSAALIGSVIDLGAHVGFGTSSERDSTLTADIGEAGGLWLNVKVATTFATSGSPAITLALYHHTSASVASGAAVDGCSKASITKNTAAGTAVLRVKLPAGTINRYLGMCETIGTAGMTGGAIDAWISLDSPSV